MDILFQGLHSASAPGILALDIQAGGSGKILTGGNDKNACVFNKDTEQVIAVLKGHTKKVTRVIYHPDEVSTYVAIEELCRETDCTTFCWTGYSIYRVSGCNYKSVGCCYLASESRAESTRRWYHWAVFTSHG